MKEGGSEHSFGIHVAQMAGMPQEIVLRSNDILHSLEKSHQRAETNKAVKEMPKVNYQMTLFEPQDPKIEELKTKLKALDINTLSPIEALLKLNELRRLVE